MIPASMIKLHKSHAALQEPSCRQAVRCEGAISWLPDAIEIERLLSFVGQVNQIGNGGLHFEGHFVLSDASGNFRIGMSILEDAVESLDLIDDLSLRRLADSIRVADIVDGHAFTLKGNSLVLAWQESRGPLSRRYRLCSGALGRHDDVAWQILSLRTETVK